MCHTWWGNKHSWDANLHLEAHKLPVKERRPKPPREGQGTLGYPANSRSMIFHAIPHCFFFETFGKKLGPCCSAWRWLMDQVRYRFSNGDEYRGEFRRGMRHGSGVYISHRRQPVCISEQVLGGSEGVDAKKVDSIPIKSKKIPPQWTCCQPFPCFPDGLHWVIEGVEDIWVPGIECSTMASGSEIVAMATALLPSKLLERPADWGRIDYIGSFERK